MLYAIIAKDQQNSLNQRLALRPAHLARIKILQDQGKLILAGPFPAIDAMAFQEVLLWLNLLL
jgi:uncharacterized protein YciI